MKVKNLGFTLVELLIVIALIAILSVAVLATINPIEQSNKARDAKFKNDAAEVLSAYERYYTSSATYPWMSTTLTDFVASIDTDVVYRSDAPHFGVVPNGANAGLLITSSELKSSFMSKESYVSGVSEDDAMYVYHNGTTNDNYVCFHPKAAVNRTMTAKLKCLNNYSATTNTGDLVDYVGGAGNCDVLATWNSAIANNVANLLCVPEGNII